MILLIVIFLLHSSHMQNFQNRPSLLLRYKGSAFMNLILVYDSNPFTQMHTVLQRQMYLIIMTCSYLLLYGPRQTREPILQRYPRAIFIQLL